MTREELRNIPGFWYLATPYSKYPDGIEIAFVDACKIAGRLIAAGVKVYSPIAHTHPIARYANMNPYAHDVWLPADKPFMDAAHGLIVCMLRSWRESSGIAAEIKLFEAAKKPIVWLSENGE